MTAKLILHIQENKPVIVELHPHVGKSVLSPKDNPIWQRFEQYVIVVETDYGRDWAGYIGTHSGAKAMLIKKYTPLEVKEIERQIAAILESGNIESVSRPDVPADFHLQDDEPEEVIDDDELDS